MANRLYAYEIAKVQKNFKLYSEPVAIAPIHCFFALVFTIVTSRVLSYKNIIARFTKPSVLAYWVVNILVSHEGLLGIGTTCLCPRSKKTKK